jgi:hypothetical protein
MLSFRVPDYSNLTICFLPEASQNWRFVEGEEAFYQTKSIPAMRPFILMLAATARASHYFSVTSDYRPFGAGYNYGAYPQDFSVVGPSLQAVHDSQTAPTGFAVDSNHSIYLTYPRNMGQTPSNVVKTTSFNDEQPWPNAAIQNCTEGQNLSTCFVNVQNVVLDSIGQLWVVDSGFPADPVQGANALYGGSKLMSFSQEVCLNP